MDTADRRFRATLLLATCSLLAAATCAVAQTETIEYYGTDAVGSVRIVFDSGGTVLGRQDYDPFGREILAAWGASSERFGGQSTDDEAQQAYFHARQFQRRIGRLMTPDFLVAQHVFNPQSLNRYSYALNNPESIQDFGGSDPKPFHIGIHGCGADSVFKESSECRTDAWMNGDTYVWQWTGEFPPPTRGGAPGHGRIPRGGSGTGSVGDNNDGSGTVIGPLQSDPHDPCSNQNPRAATPDFVHVQFNAGAFVGGSIGMTQDRYGTSYLSVGVNIGRSDPISGGVTVGRVFGSRKQSHVNAVISGWSASAGAALPLPNPLLLEPGGNVSANASGASAELGIMTPQAGGGLSYTWQLPGGVTCSK
jgi:RHS repeat-associated protein